MAIERAKTELLHEAMTRFNSASTDLERYYQTLTRQVQELKQELEASHREKEALRQQAERNRRLTAVGEMAARMAHELRNPLGSIELFASLLRKKLSKEADERQWAEHISTAVRAMDFALSNLLIFTGKPRPYFKKTDLKKTLEEARCFASHLIEQHRINFIQSGPKLSQEIRCDEDLMRQVFLNLILNAIDAMPNGGSLEISFENISKGTIALAVTDTGIGIPKEALPCIFDPFFTTKQKGTGLGLAIVHNAIESHGGNIRVQSDPGLGTRFTIRLPVNPVKTVSSESRLP